MKTPTIEEQIIMGMLAVLVVIMFFIFTIVMSSKYKGDYQGLEEMQDFHESRVKADYPNENVNIILFDDENQ